MIMSDDKAKYSDIMDGIRLLATICMYTIGGFVLLMGIAAMVSGDILSSIIITCGGLIVIPIIRNKIATATNTKRISGSIAMVIMVVMLFVGFAFASPIPSDVSTPEITSPHASATPIITPNPTPLVTPTPDIIAISAVKMLPLGTELGDKSGWRSKLEDGNTYNVAIRKYYKDNRRVVITINVLSDNDDARTLYYEKHNRFGYDEYPTLDVGELSLIYTMTASNSYHECSYGCFVNKNIFVEIDVDDYRISDHEMCIYAKQVNRKIKV